MTRPDLHLHTSASDGLYDSSQIARMAQQADVTLFSITDHDTLAGLPQAIDAAYDRGLAFIPGVEISTEGEDEVHILGYGVSPEDPALNALFARMDQARIDRVRRMADRLSALGMPLPVEKIFSRQAGSVGRPHLGRAMVEQGYVASVSEAFDRWLNVGRPAYLSRETPTAEEAVALLRQRGAVPVLAHPGEISWSTEKLMDKLDAWQKAGLRGIEVYHPANRGRYAEWDRLARSRGLLVTGGSDYHDGLPRHGQIGETIAEWKTAAEDGWALFQAAPCRY